MPHQNEGKDHDDPDRKINARGQNDKRLRRGKDTDHRHLLHDQCQRIGREKAQTFEVTRDPAEFQQNRPVPRGGKEDDQRDKHDHRHRSRVGMQVVLKLAQAASVFVEMRDACRALVKNLFEFLWLAHLSPHRPKPSGPCQCKGRP